MRALLFAALGASVLAGACGDHEFDIDRVGGPLPAPIAGAGGEAGTAGSGGATVDAGSDGATVPDNPAFPCDVREIVEGVCRRCHQAMPEGGHMPPFPLETWEDTQVEYFNRPIWERMLDAVKSGFMPLAAPPLLDPPVQPLTMEQKETMMTWLEGGAIPVDGDVVTCDAPSMDASADSPSDASPDAPADAAPDAPVEAGGD